MKSKWSFSFMWVNPKNNGRVPTDFGYYQHTHIIARSTAEAVKKFEASRKSRGLEIPEFDINQTHLITDRGL